MGDINIIDLSIRYELNTGDQDRMTELKKRFSAISLGQDLLDMAEENDISILFDYQDDLDSEYKECGYYLQREGAVVLNGHFSDDRLIATLAHELRHAWQDISGLMEEQSVNPFRYLTLRRVEEADAYSFETHFLFELSMQANDTAPLECFGESYFDIFEAYANKMEESDFPIDARRAAFDAFFETKKWELYDEDALSLMEANLEIYKDLSKDPEWVQSACEMKAADGPLTEEKINLFGVLEIESKGPNFMTDVPGESVLNGKHSGVFTKKTQERLAEVTQSYNLFFRQLGHKQIQLSMDKKR